MFHPTSVLPACSFSLVNVVADRQLAEVRVTAPCLSAGGTECGKQRQQHSNVKLDLLLYNAFFQREGGIGMRERLARDPRACVDG